MAPADVLPLGENELHVVGQARVERQRRVVLTLLRSVHVDWTRQLAVGNYTVTFSGSSGTCVAASDSSLISWPLTSVAARHMAVWVAGLKPSRLTSSLT